MEFYQAERTNYKEQLGQATLNISIDEDNIDSYYLEISYGIHPSNQNNLVFFDVSFSPKGALPEDSGIDLPIIIKQYLSISVS